MGLADIFERNLDTGINFRLLPIGFEDIQDLREGKYKSEVVDPNKILSPKQVLDYAFFANLFSGDYEVEFNSKDNGFKPILVPRQYLPIAKTLQVKLTFPRDIFKSSHDEGINTTGIYYVEHSDWRLHSSTQPQLFCSIPIEGVEVSARLYFKTKKSEKVLSARLESPDKVREDFIAKLYDVQLRKKDDQFVFEPWNF